MKRMSLALRKTAQIGSKGPVSFGRCHRESWDDPVCGVVVGLVCPEDCFRLHLHHQYRRAIYKVAQCREMTGLVGDQADPNRLLLVQQQYHQ